MKATTSRRMLLIAGVLALLSAGATAQGFYDDDIYFDASKAKKEKVAKVGAAVRTGESAAESQAGFEAGSTRNVDEYNRRGNYKPVQETAAELGDNFTYTRRIEQFSNPDIVAASNDDELKYYYSYADDELASSTGSASPSVINIYVNNPDPWEYLWRPYYYPSAWSWAVRPSYCYYHPWWGYDYWGPSWGYGPVWGTSWGWGWAHHHGPSWSWGWTPGWGGWYPSHTPQKPANRPGGMPGVSGTHGRPTAGNSVGRRPSGTRPTVTTGTGRTSGQTVSGRRPGNSRPASGYNPSDATRPGNTSATTSGRTGNVRRGSSTSTSTTYGRTSVSGNSGRTSSSSSSSSSSSYNPGRSSYNSGRSSYSGGGSSSGRSGGSSGGSGRTGGGRR